MAEPSPELAAVDLGSNSFHMVIARLVGGQLTILDRMRDRVQLAAGFDAENRLTDDAERRALACLERFKQRLRSVAPERVRAVGTNTLRKAKNAHDFLPRAQAALGHPIEVISGREEARIIYLGVSHTLADSTGRRLVVDIGGGSTECIIGEHFDAQKTESLHMGCVSHTLRFFPDGRLRRESFRDAMTAACVELEPFERDFSRLGWVSAIGSSGTINAIEQILRTNGWSEGITREGLQRLREAMIELGRVGKLSSLPGLSADRANVLPGGLAILLGIFKSLKLTQMMASPGALREGLLYDMLGSSTREDVRETTIQRMMKRHHVDAEQAARVEATAMRSFDQVAHAWSLHNPELRWQLAWASRLHEIGLTVSYSGYHHHGAYIVTHSDMPGFSQQKQAFLAALIRAHRRRLRPAVVQELRTAGGDTALYLAILLRLAATLNRSRHPDALPQFKLSAGLRTLILEFPPGWLEAHPMTQADLQNEQQYLAAAGFHFTST